MTWDKLLFVLLLVFWIINPVYAASTLKSPVRALVLYESETRWDENYPLVDALVEQLGHFNLKVDKLPCKQWTPKTLSGYKIVFYIGSEKAVLHEGLLREMESVPRLVWMEQNIEQYARLKNWPNFINKGERYQFTSLEYKQQRIPCPSNIPIFCAYPSSGATTIAFADNQALQVPYIWRLGNFWYIGRFFFEVPELFILGDVLHDICDENHPPKREVLVRIEDVNPTASPVKLQKLIDAITERNIPYAVGVSPANIVNGKLITLMAAPELVKVLQQVEFTGGCIILHGYTHQNPLFPQTGEGFEYWDARKDAPLSGNEKETVNRSINNGLDLLARYDIYPVAFEPPHYAMSKEGYKVLSTHFNLFSGHIQLSDKTFEISVTAPYTFWSTRAKTFVYPENLGYFDPNQPDSVDDILTNAKYLTLVRDCSGCFFYHNFLPPDNLGKIIDGLKQLGYQFIDLRLASYHVTGKNVSFISQNGERKLIKRNISSPKEGNAFNMYFGKWTTVLMVVILIIVSFFIFILWLTRKRRTRLYEEG